jgi:hypothetical protein
MACTFQRHHMHSTGAIPPAFVGLHVAAAQQAVLPRCGGVGWGQGCCLRWPGTVLRSGVYIKVVTVQLALCVLPSLSLPAGCACWAVAWCPRLPPALPAATFWNTSQTSSWTEQHLASSQLQYSATAVQCSAAPVQQSFAADSATQ